MDKFAIEVPINPLSFGQTAVNILKEFYKMGLSPSIFPIGEKVDLSAFDKASPDFVNWLNSCVNNRFKTHNRNYPIFKLWHLRPESISSFSKKQALMTFYEVDAPTELELGILRNQDSVLVSSKHTQKVFDDIGCKSIFCPLGFDSDSFYPTERKYLSDKITFGLAGKLEKRKNHHKILAAWVKKYGNNPRYMLNCAIQNPFIPQEQQAQFLMSVFGGKRYYNVNLLGFMPVNSFYNDFLNSNDIIIGMSSGEGWGLPEFQSLCLGKHGVILDAHAYRDWADDSVATMVKSCGKIECYDGVFFKKGAEYNQGSYFDWNEDDFLAACEDAEKRFSENPINEQGKKLAQKFTWENTAKIILENL